MGGGLTNTRGVIANDLMAKTTSKATYAKRQAIGTGLMGT